MSGEGSRWDELSDEELVAALRERLPSRDWLVWQIIQVERRGIGCLASDPEVQEAVSEYLDERSEKHRRLVEQWKAQWRPVQPPSLMSDETRQWLSQMQREGQRAREEFARLFDVALTQAPQPTFTGMSLPAGTEVLPVTSEPVQAAEDRAATDQHVEILGVVVKHLAASNGHLEAMARRAVPPWVAYVALGLSVVALIVSATQPFWPR